MRSQVSIFQSTPSAWRETTACQELFPAENISIHSLRMEGDGHSQKNTPTFNISIHSLRMEGDYTSTEVKARYNDFNPLPPHGGRRIHSLSIQQLVKYFNPLPPHGGRPASSTHFSGRQKFQSTPSAWRETRRFHSWNGHKFHFNPLPPHGGRRYPQFS